jgi:hypothetical protein
MGGQVIAVRVDDVELLVETSRVVGTENTSVAGRTQQVVDAFERAQDAIVAVSTKVGGTVARMAARGARPDRMEVEFGLKFSGKGDVIVASGSAEVALKVVIGYDAARSTPGGAAAGQPDDDAAGSDAAGDPS